MGRIGLGEVAPGIEYERVIGTGRIRLELGEDRSELVAAVDVLVEHIREWPPDCRGVENETGLVVNRLFVFGEDEERAALGVDSRVEPGRVFDRNSRIPFRSANRCPPQRKESYFPSSTRACQSASGSAPMRSRAPLSGLAFTQARVARRPT